MTEAEAVNLAVAGRLLAYPDGDYFASLPDLREEAGQAASEPSALPFTQAVQDFVADAEAMGQSALAEQYVAVFDHASSASLYLTWHRYGNDRSQGKAMAALNGLYRAYGYEPQLDTLPDYLPKMLEFLSVAPDDARRIMLDGFGPEIDAVINSLAEMKSAHAPMLKAAIDPLKRDFADCFRPRTGVDPTKRPMSNPEPEPEGPLIPPPEFTYSHASAFAPHVSRSQE